MMASGGILNADMATLARWARQGLDWWLEEMCAMTPAPLRRAMQRRWPVAQWDGRQWQAAKGALKGRMELRLPAHSVLVRAVPLPPMARRDLLAAVGFDIDRLMPLPADALVWALGERPAHGGAVSLAVAERAALAEALAAAGAAGVVPAAITAQVDGETFDFTGAARGAGLVAGGLSGALVWWLVVAALVAMNGATLIWRDIDSVDRLQERLDSRLPMAEAVQRSARHLQAGLGVARAQADARRRHDPLRTLAAVTQALPPQAWVQRWSWDGRHVRISGYARGGLDVVRALRDSHRFADVRNASSEVMADIPIGHPFDVLIQLEAG